MTLDLDDTIRRAFDDVFDATPPLGPCPTLDRGVLVNRFGHSRGQVEQPTRAQRPRRQSVRDPGRPPRWVAVAAGIIVVVGLASVVLVAQRSDRATTSAGTVDLGPVEQFAAGSITGIADPPVFVVNDPTAGIVVLDAHSTHLDCLVVENDQITDPTVRSNKPDVVFVDPCHFSQFDRVGEKLAGPAPRSLDRYDVQITDQHVIIDLSRRKPGQPATSPNFLGADVDTTLPTVGRAWADSMDFSLSSDLNARLFNVSQTAIANCMHTRGFPDYQPITFPDNANFQDLVNPLDRRYATIMGYHELPAEPNDPNSYTDDTYAALNGPAGCGDTAFADTYDRISDYTTINDRLRNGLASVIAGFPESQPGSDVTSQWAACMADSGYPFTSPSEARNAFAGRPTISTREIETRLADLDCDLAVGYTQQQHDWEQTQIDIWRDSEQATIADAVAQLQLADDEIIATETIVYGSDQQ